MHRKLLEEAEASTLAIQREAELLLRVNREILAAIDNAPRTPSGVIISLTLSEEAILLLKQIATPLETSLNGAHGYLGGITIYKKDA